MVIKIKSRREPGAPHVEDTIFVGHDREHVNLVGRLTFGIDMLYAVRDFGGPSIHGVTGEWQLFQTALALGAQRMNGDVEVIFDGDEEIVRQLEAESHEH